MNKHLATTGAMLRRCRDMRFAVITGFLAWSAACTTGPVAMYPVDSPARAALDLPDQFMIGTIEPGGALSEPHRDGGCRSPMVDPRDGTRLILVQSGPGADGQVGDYRVPEGRYGVRAGELLRLDCGTGRAIGVVPPRG